MKQRLRELTKSLTQGLIQRDEAARLALLSALAGEHLLLIGEPGTAKSILARKLNHVFIGGQYFERLLTKFSVPEELFGPLSIKALENDCYKRLTDRYLPSASIAFIDEIFKANSAILNALLTLLNEREFDNGDARLKVPLISVIAVSNELPDDEGLEALYDRFLCRYHVKPVSADRFFDLLQLKEQSEIPDKHKQLSAEDIQQIQQQADDIELSEETLGLLAELRDFLQQKQLYVSDRRWRKVIKLLKVAAFTNGQTTVSIWDCWLLQHCLWHSPEQRELIFDWYQSHVGIGSGFNPQRLEKLVKTWEQVLQQDSDSKIQRFNEQNQLLYIDKQGEITTDAITVIDALRKGEVLYLAPSDQPDRSNNGQGYSRAELEQLFFDDRYQQTHIDGHWVHLNQYIADIDNRYTQQYQNEPCMEPKKHGETFINSRLKETSNIAEDIENLQYSLEQQADSVGSIINDHLWLMPEFSDVAEMSLKGTLQVADNLLKRIQVVIEGYRQLA